MRLTAKPAQEAFEIRKDWFRALTKRPAWYIWDTKNECIHPNSFNKMDRKLRYYQTEWGAASYRNTMNKLAAGGGV